MINPTCTCTFQDEVQEAYILLKDLEPTVPQEYILKGVVNAAIGQETGSVSLVINGHDDCAPIIPEEINPLTTA